MPMTRDGANFLRRRLIAALDAERRIELPRAPPLRHSDNAIAAERNFQLVLEMRVRIISRARLHPPPRSSHDPVSNARWRGGAGAHSGLPVGQTVALSLCEGRQVGSRPENTLSR